MSDALNYIYYSFNKFVEFLFSSYMFPGVSLGSVLLVVIIFSLLMRTVLNIPFGLPKHDDSKGGDTNG